MVLTFQRGSTFEALCCTLLLKTFKPIPSEDRPKTVLACHIETIGIYNICRLITPKII